MTDILWNDSAFKCNPDLSDQKVSLIHNLSSKDDFPFA